MDHWPIAIVIVLVAVSPFVVADSCDALEFTLYVPFPRITR
jgi:hypothetical protein